MNRTDRMLGIVLALQRQGKLRAEDLAAAFETSVRTIYRDVQALSEAGVPVVGAPGQGYWLLDGYFLPPVSFTVEESVSILLGLTFIEQSFDDGFRSRSREARAKLEGVLPESVRNDVARIKSGMRLLDTGTDVGGKEQEKFLAMLRLAVLEERRIRFCYVKAGVDSFEARRSARKVDPYGLVLVNGSWVLIGYCHLRKNLRHFRLKRMSELVLLDERGTRPKQFDLHAYQPVDDRDVLVHIWVHPERMDQVKESPSFYLEFMETRQDGLYMTFRVRTPDELLQWVLGWGGGVIVLEPASFRERVRQEVEKMLKHY